MKPQKKNNGVIPLGTGALGTMCPWYVVMPAYCIITLTVKTMCARGIPVKGAVIISIGLFFATFIVCDVGCAPPC